MMRPVLLCTLMVVAVSGSTNMLRSPRRVTAAESEQSGVSLEDLERKLQIVAFYGSPSCALADKKNDQYFDVTVSISRPEAENKTKVCDKDDEVALGVAVQTVIADMDYSGTKVEDHAFTAVVCAEPGQTSSEPPLTPNKRMLQPAQWRFVRGGGICRTCNPDNNDNFIIDVDALDGGVRKLKKPVNTSVTHAFRTMEVQLADKVKTALKRSNIKCLKGVDVDVIVTFTPTDSFATTHFGCS